MPLPYGAWIKRAARWLYVTTTNLSVTRKTLMPWTFRSLVLGGSFVWSALCICILFALYSVSGGRRYFIHILDISDICDMCYIVMCVSAPHVQVLCCVRVLY